MGRPVRDERMEMRLTGEHKALIERAAALEGVGVTAFAVAALVDRAREIVEAHEITRLSDRDRDRFLAALDAEPNEALLAAVLRRARA